MKIDHIFIINLKRDVDRKKRMEKQLKKHDLQNYTFFEAIDGQNEDLSKYDFKVIPEWYDPIHKKIMTRGEIGCALSHYKIWEQNGNGEFENVLVLEDDAILPEYFSKEIEEIDMTNIEFDFLYLGRNKVNKNITEEKINDFLLIPSYSYRTHAYILHKNGSKKLLSCNYLNHLLPIDEFLSLLYDKTCYPFIHYSKYFTDLPILNTLSVYPLMIDFERIKHISNTFKSNTIHSDPYILEKKDDFLVITIATDVIDVFKRFQKSCDIYGIPYKILGLNTIWKGGDMNDIGCGQKINLLREELLNWTSDKLKKTIILITDSYDVIFTTNQTEILHKYHKLIGKTNSILFSGEKFCWPDRSLSKKYPKVNSSFKYLNAGGFIGNAYEILHLLDIPIKDTDDEQLYYTNKYLHFLQNDVNYCNKIQIDYNCEIFQTLNGFCNVNIDFQIKTNQILNLETNSHPCILHGNGPAETKFALSRIADYICNGWSSDFLFCITNVICDLPIIFIHSAENIEKDIFDYPPEKLIIQNSNNHNIQAFLETDAEYYFYIENGYVIQNINILRELLNANKNIIAPMFLDECFKPNYNTIIDTQDNTHIIQYESKSIWTVSNIWGIYLLKRNVIETYINENSNKELFEFTTSIKHTYLLHISNLSFYGSFQNTNKLNVYNKIKTTVLNHYNSTMNPIHIWNIPEQLDALLPFTEIKKDTKLLDLKKNRDEYDILENAVLKIMEFHVKRLEMVIDDSIHVEFWLKNTSDIHNFHLDCDEYERKENKKYYHPLVSCITYLNDHTDPTFISNVSHEEYKYKDFDEQTGFSLIVPEKGKHICFDGSKYHGVTYFDKNDCLPRYILAVNIWKTRKPTNMEYYVSNEAGSNIDLTFTEEIDALQNIELKNDSKINVSIFNDLLYDKNNYKLLEIKDWLDVSVYKNVSIHFKKKEMAVILDKKKNVQADLDFIKNDGKFTMNRFLQRCVFPKVYTPDICKWIVEEGEKHASKTGGWTTCRHKNYPTTDLPVKDIPTVYSFILSSLPSNLDKIMKMYGLEGSKINICDLFLVKYHENMQNELEVHKDGSVLSFGIVLSNPCDYEGGGTMFEDGIHYSLEQGDMLVHSGRVNHTGMKITRGTRYVLVAFLYVTL